MSTVRRLISVEEWATALPVIQSLRPQLTLERLLSFREANIKLGYLLFGLFQDNELVCVAGAVIQPHIEHGTELWIHDLATMEKHRSRGYGGQIMSWLMEFGRQQKCFRVSVHTRTERAEAQRFYVRCGLKQTALVYQILLDDIEPR